MSRWRIEGRWILFLPVVCFLAGTWFFRTERTDVRVAYERGRDAWREGDYAESIETFLRLQAQDPGSETAPDCLWEVATIYYYNLYDISSALYYFERLIAEYPSSPHALQSHLKLAEIFEIELNEIPNALAHWEEAVGGDLEPRVRGEILFKIADSHFKLGQLDQAFDEFKRLAEATDLDTHLRNRTRLRLGTILQLRRAYESSIDVFSTVLDSDPCPSCRLQAQMGQVESYELLDRLDQAIAVAENISPDDYPSEERQALLRRLEAKQRYY